MIAGAMGSTCPVTDGRLRPDMIGSSLSDRFGRQSRGTPWGERTPRQLNGTAPRAGGGRA